MTAPLALDAPRRTLPLAWRVFLVNAFVLTVGATALLLSPASVSAQVILEEAVILLAGLLVLLGINLYLVRRSLAPLDRVMRAMQGMNLLGEPDQRINPEGPPEVRQLIAVFDDMVDRLQRERRESARRALAAQEAERKRVAQELHDEIGQSLTALKLQLARLGRRAPDELQADLHEAQGEIDASLGDVRRIAMRLRPVALDDLGLVPALTALAADFSERTGIKVRRRIAAPLPTLSPESELVLFRVAQESLTNVARHSGAASVELELACQGTTVQLVIADDGKGFDDAPAGAGIEGMRERALLVDGRFSLATAAAGGTRVQLDVPGGV